MESNGVFIQYLAPYNEILYLNNKYGSFLWENGCYGLSPKKDIRATPLFFPITRTEIHHLLRCSEGGKLNFDFRVDRGDNARLTSHELLEQVNEKYGELAAATMVVYSDLRDRGWVVHGGLNYGADFLLYRGSPDDDHSPYALTVSCPKERAVTWRDIVPLSRVAVTAKKKLLVAHIELLEGTSLKHENFNIKYLEIERWIPEEARMQNVSTQ